MTPFNIKNMIDDVRKNRLYALGSDSYLYGALPVFDQTSLEELAYAFLDNTSISSYKKVFFISCIPQSILDNEVNNIKESLKKFRLKEKEALAKFGVNESEIREFRSSTDYRRYFWEDIHYNENYKLFLKDNLSENHFLQKAMRNIEDRNLNGFHQYNESFDYRAELNPFINFIKACIARNKWNRGFMASSPADNLKESLKAINYNPLFYITLGIVAGLGAFYGLTRINELYEKAIQSMPPFATVSLPDVDIVDDMHNRSSRMGEFVDIKFSLTKTPLNPLSILLTPLVYLAKTLAVVTGTIGGLIATPISVTIATGKSLFNYFNDKKELHENIKKAKCKHESFINGIPYIITGDNAHLVSELFQKTAARYPEKTDIIFNKIKSHLLEINLATYSSSSLYGVVKWFLEAEDRETAYTFAKAMKPTQLQSLYNVSDFADIMFEVANIAFYKKEYNFAKIFFENARDAASHNNNQILADDCNRWIACIEASLRGESYTVETHGRILAKEKNIKGSYLDNENSKVKSPPQIDYLKNHGFLSRFGRLLQFKSSDAPLKNNSSFKI